MNTTNACLRVTAILLCAAVLFGAVGAHVLRPLIAADRLAIFEKGVLYQFLNALGVGLVAVLGKVEILSIKRSNQICTLLSAGVVIFSGSLYLLILTQISLFGAITPIGGLALIGSWAWLAFSLKA